MKGLRERKKNDRKTIIHGAAIKLFGEKGFEKTTMENIASKADLGVGTLYNYFASKGDILLSIIEDRSAIYESKLDEILAGGDYSLDAIGIFIDNYLQSFSFYSKSIWREFIGSLLTRQKNSFDFIEKIDSVFIIRLSKLLNGLKGKKIIDEKTDIETLTETLYGILIFNILKYVSTAKMSLNNLKENIKKQYMLLFR